MRASRRRRWWLGGIGLGAIALVTVRYATQRVSWEQPPPPRSTRIHAAPLCPWRDPQADLAATFPQADHWEPETRILSGLRLELARRLGRPVQPDESALRLYRVSAGPAPLGVVMIRRVRGDYGAIEVVVAVDASGKVRAVRLQRLREPEAVMKPLRETEWLGAFRGKSVHDSFHVGGDLPAVPPSARVTAGAIAEGVRSLLILLDTGTSPRALAATHHH